MLSGVTGEDVFAVPADLVEGGTTTVLPVSIEGMEAGGFSFTVGVGEIDRFTLVDSARNEINAISKAARQARNNWYSDVDRFMLFERHRAARQTSEREVDE